MKKYDLDQIIDRKGTYSCKWEQLPEGTPADALPLWVADMDFPCADPILEALHKRIDRQILGYSIYENDECKSAVTGWFKRRFNWDVEKNNIFFSPGVVPAIAFLLDILTKEGDGVLIQKPVYYPFSGKIEGNRRTIVNNPLIYQNGRYEIDFEDLEAKMSVPANKGMILCSPHNPVGRVWTEQELKSIVEICKKYDKWIISDEIHFDLVRKGVKHQPLLKLCPEYKDRIIVCTAPSKTFNLAGMQLSNIVIPNPEYQKLWNAETGDKLSVNFASPLGITAVIAAYNESEDWLNQVNDYIDANIAFAKEYFAQNLPKAKMVEPEGTYLIWVDLREYCSDAKKLEELMIQKAKVVLDEGYIFGEEGVGFERINAACPRSILKECLDRMKNALL